MNIQSKKKTNNKKKFYFNFFFQKKKKKKKEKKMGGLKEEREEREEEEEEFQFDFKFREHPFGKSNEAEDTKDAIAFLSLFLTVPLGLILLLDKGSYWCIPLLIWTIASVHRVFKTLKKDGYHTWDVPPMTKKEVGEECDRYYSELYHQLDVFVKQNGVNFEIEEEETDCWRKKVSIKYRAPFINSENEKNSLVITKVQNYQYPDYSKILLKK